MMIAVGGDRCNSRCRRKFGFEKSPLSSLRRSTNFFIRLLADMKKTADRKPSAATSIVDREVPWLCSDWTPS